MSREDQYNVTVQIDDGVNNAPVKLGTFDTKTGGEVDSEETKYRPGNMGEQISLGGYKTVSNVTVGRLLDLDRDLPLRADLIAAVGVSNCTVSVQHLAVNGLPKGSPDVYKGKLKQFSMPDHDSMSADPAKFELEISSVTMVVV